MNILVINAGSSSLKYQLINMNTEAVLAKGGCERIGLEASKLECSLPVKRAYEIPMSDHREAFVAVKRALTEGETKVVGDMSEIDAVGHRVVMGGPKLQRSARIDGGVLAEIERAADLAPLHNPAGIQGIRACLAVLGDNVPQVAVFDTAFHSTMPPEAYTFPLPYEICEKYNLRRYGFHGTSHQFVSLRCAELMGRGLEELKLITCHLGNGASIAAVKYGQVVDTSMGLTPLDGFLMGTRCGGVDPSAVLYLMKKEGWTPDQASNVLNKQSGALGVSGVSSDDRDIRDAAAGGNERALLARVIQRYQVRKFIGAYAAAMNGVDAIIFTGGIGENTFDLRADVCENLSFLGIAIDPAENDRLVHGKEGELSTPDAKVKVFVIPTNEELVIAKETRALA
ncbi:MAG: acetate kinase [Oscillospiraceae bacterium]|nr:acetate kinase [Oscillospiraceae bacterium]